MNRFAALLAVVGLAAVSCGAPANTEPGTHDVTSLNGTDGSLSPLPTVTSPDPTVLDTCTYVRDPDAIYDPVPVYAPLMGAQVWLEMRTADLAASVEAAEVAQGDRPYLQLGNVAALLETSEMVADHRDPDFGLRSLQLRPEALPALGGLGDERVLVSVTKPAASPRVGIVLWESGDGSIGATGTCDDEAIADFVNEYAASHAPEPAWDVLRRLAQDPNVGKTLGDWYDGEPPRWEDRDPSLRQIDPESTPAEIFDALTMVNVRVGVPVDWRTGKVLCGRTDLAWQECVDLTNSDGLVPVEFFVYVEGDDVVELWILDSGANLSEPLLRLGSVRYELGVSELSLEIIPPDRKTLEDLITEAVPLDIVFVVGTDQAPGIVSLVGKEVACSVGGSPRFPTRYLEGPDLTREGFAATDLGRILESFFVGGEGEPEGGQYGAAEGFSVVSDSLVLGYRAGLPFADFRIQDDSVAGWGGCNPTLVSGDLVAYRWQPVLPVDAETRTVLIQIEGGGCVTDTGTQGITDIVSIEVIEDEDHVGIVAWARQPLWQGPCAGVGLYVDAEADLAEPLGGRTLINAGTVPATVVDQ